MRAPILATCAVGLSLVPACAANPSNHDAGDVAFVHQASQVLLCRKPRSTLEVSVLASRVATHGRAGLLAALMKTPEFYDCWTQILVDHMQVQRSGEYAQLATCVNEPTFVVEDPVPCTDGNPATLCEPCNDSDPAGSCVAKAEALATHIRDDRPRDDLVADLDNDGLDDTWNMHDVIRAALLTDDLHIAWRPWMFAIAGRPQVTGGPTDSEVRDNFLASAFGVNTECLSCHSSTYSKTEVYAGLPNTWDRTANMGFDLHGGLFGTGATVNMAQDPTGVYSANCQGCHGPDGTWSPGGHPKPHVERIPLLTRSAIITQILEGSTDESGAFIMAPQDLDNDGVIGPADPDDVTAATALADFLYEQLGGQEDMAAFTQPDQFADPAANDGNFTGRKGPFGMSEVACGFQWRHDSVHTAPTTFFGAAGNRLFSVGGVTTDTPDLGTVESALKQGVAVLTSQSNPDDSADQVGPTVPNMADPEASVAGLLAENIVGHVLAELTGNPATAPHGLPRTTAQADLFRDAIMVLPVNRAGVTALSLKSVLGFALLSELFNRRAPIDPVAPSPDNGYDAYQLDMYVNPWAATETGIPDTTGNNLNGQGDGVTRRSPNQLLWSLHHDLGWPAPNPFPDPFGSVYPTSEWMRQIGRYESARLTGSSVWQLDSLVMWESQIGQCTSPDGAPDFIDELVGDALAAVAIPTVKSITLGLKDRLLQEPFFHAGLHGLNGESEETLLKDAFNAVLGAGAWNKAAKPAKAALLEDALRDYCGVLLLSPDYLLRNIPTVTTTPPTAGVFTTCLPDEPCTQSELEAHYDCFLGRAGVISPAPVCP